jgi:Fur family transcriptional regulator, ferric uptake regulator
MTSQPIDVDEALRSAGYRVTVPRQLVWGVLREASGHLTAEQIADRIQAANDQVNLASVYRALAVLADLDLVRETRLGDGTARWELSHPDEHFHLVCDRCGSITHHEGNLVEMVAEHLRAGHDFDPTAIELVVSGRCGRCRRAEA